MVSPGDVNALSMCLTTSSIAVSLRVMVKIRLASGKINAPCDAERELDVTQGVLELDLAPERPRLVEPRDPAELEQQRPDRALMHVPFSDSGDRQA
jgi:hypothetical protein